MQKFYLAVCYEGLDNTKKAIEVLEMIKDNISNQNLVNKYLKLSMLYLKLNDFSLAKKHYKTALLYDKEKRNPTFLLAECDLLMFEKNYLKALEVYEDYFIKTKNRYRYLDRYLDIQIALNQLAEGYDFYEKHLSVMQRVLSKQSRLKFYEASLKLMKKLKNYKQEAFLEKLITEIKESLTPLNNIFDYLSQLLENNYDKTFLKPRDIIHAVFNEASYSRLFSKLIYVKLEDGLVKLLHLTKGLLLEKDWEISSTDNNVYQDLKNLKFKQVYLKEDLTNVSNDPYLTGKDKYIFVKEVKEFQYLVFYVNHEDYYLAKKVFDISALLIQKLLNEFLRHGFNQSLVKNLLEIFDNEKYGLFLLKENQLHLLNNTAKVLLDVKSDYLSMETFQAHLVKNIYVDELLKIKEVTVKYQTEEIKEIQFKIFTDDLDIYLLGKRPIEQINIKKYHDFKYIKEELINDDNAIIYFNLRNYHDFMKDYSYARYDNLLNKIYETIRLSSRNYYQNIYLEGRDNLYLILATKDKRIIKRIYEDVFRLLENEVDIRASLVYLKQEITTSDLEDLHYLNALTSKEVRFIQDNKAYRQNREIAKTILENVKKILTENNLKLSYSPVTNYQTNTYKFLYIDVLNRILLGNKESLTRVIKANDLEIDWDYLMIDTLVKDIRLANISNKYMLEVSIKSLLDTKSLAMINKRLNNKSFNRSELIFVIDYEEFLEYNFAGLKNYKLAFKNFAFSYKLKNIKDLAIVDYVIFNKEEVEDSTFLYLQQIMEDYNKGVIYDHQKFDLTKSFLETKKLLLVMGEAYGKYDSLSRLKKLEED